MEEDEEEGLEPDPDAWMTELGLMDEKRIGVSEIDSPEKISKDKWDKVDPFLKSKDSLSPDVLSPKTAEQNFTSSASARASKESKTSSLKI